MKRLFFILIFYFISCITSQNKNEDSPLPVSKFDSTLLNGTWWTCNKLRNFRLIEFGDTVYQYLEQEQYTGPSVLFRYSIKGDTLFLESDESWYKDKWLIAKVDSSIMTLIDEYDTTVFKKIRLKYSLKNYSNINEKEYANQFFSLKKKFGCQ